MEGDGEGSIDVLEEHVHAAGAEGVAHIVEDEVAVAVGEGDLEGGLVVQALSPGDELLRCVGVGGVKRGPLGGGLGSGEGVRGGDAAAPVELLELATGIDAEDVGDVAAVEAEGFGRGIEGGGGVLGGGGESGGQEESSCKCFQHGVVFLWGSVTGLMIAPGRLDGMPLVFRRWRRVERLIDWR